VLHRDIDALLLQVLLDLVFLADTRHDSPKAILME